ncbi:MAG TPA: hypothetical protein VIL36_17700 [Acidimicrobiales bacterium]
MTANPTPDPAALKRKARRREIAERVQDVVVAAFLIAAVAAVAVFVVAVESTIAVLLLGVVIGALAGWLATWHHYVGRRTGIRLRAILAHYRAERQRPHQEAADDLTELIMLGYSAGPVKPGLETSGGQQ